MTGTLTVNGLIINHWATAASSGGWARHRHHYPGLTYVAVLGFAWLWWVASAHTWFTGPKVQGTAEELAEIERELTT